MPLHPDRLFPADPTLRGLARELYGSVKDLPIVSPHGHTEPRWYAEDAAFPDPVALFIKPDHYVFRMLYSQGVPLEAMGIPDRHGEPKKTDDRAIWRLFAENWYLFRATPSRLWFEHSLESVFGITERLTPLNADRIYDQIADALQKPELRPRALYDAFRIEAISTTDAATDDLRYHDQVLTSGWHGRVLPAYRPDFVIDPEREGFAQRVAEFVALTGMPLTWAGYLDAHRARRAYFKARGATSSDHGHPSARTANLSRTDAAALFERVTKGNPSPEDAELFRAQMLTEMARMSIEDGLVMQIHPGAFRNHNRDVFAAYGADKGADIPARTDYVRALKPLLDEVGNRSDLTIILFTLDETTYSRELAPLAGHYPALRLGPAWWFYDSPEGMLRYRQMVTETAGFYNTVGFNDDTRAYLSIPARHDVARRVDCSYLAGLVATHQLELEEAHEVAVDLAYRLAKKAYRI
ncbi:glucuronate isomerase [Paradevosia shaoguanensis]|uniref:glucuronate isomerase n=1 Tax=Paradevosia shaoguanensis TaxID=1335043 RepID=UPI00193204DC|nr:glucuronate isomerase [Paradevosia shaoguanensis]